MTEPNTSLVLQLIEGPELGGLDRVWRAKPERPIIIGRGQDANARLPDASVSRSHAELAFDGVAWALQDLGSRHGCVVNGRVLRPSDQITLTNRDEIQIGAWTFRVLLDADLTSVVTVSPEEKQEERVRRVAPGEIGTLIKRRFEVVLAAAAELGGATTETQAAEMIAHSVAGGMGSARVAVVAIEQDNSIGSILASSGDQESFELSRSLLLEAARGETVVLEPDEATHAYGMSIAELGIRSACCAPITVGDRVQAVLYLDARDDSPVDRLGRQPGADSASFVHAMARIGGLAMSNIRRSALEINRLQIESDLQAARVAQRIMMPASKGSTHGLDYAVLNRPGRFVAGDLIGIEPSANGRVCFYLGDVTGKGVGAAMLMGIAQSSLHASLAAGAPIHEAAMRLNHLLAPRIDTGQFISLWIGEYDPADRTLTATDCGHGYTLLVSDNTIQQGIGAGSYPIGIDAGQTLESSVTTIKPGSTLLVFSDGLVEQTSPTGEQFGVEGIHPILRTAQHPDTMLAALVDSLSAHAQSDRFDDDLTIAAFRFN